MEAHGSESGRGGTALLSSPSGSGTRRSAAARAQRHIELTRLAVAAREGDHRAFDALVAATQLDLHRYCVVLSDRRSAEDLAQETYLLAVTAIQRFRGDASPMTWLCGIARRRQGVHERNIPRAFDPSSEIAADCADEVEMRALLASIDPDRRAAFGLTQVLGLRYQDAAELLGCPVGTVRSRVARARADLFVAVAADN